MGRGRRSGPPVRALAVRPGIAGGSDVPPQAPAPSLLGVVRDGVAYTDQMLDQAEALLAAHPLSGPVRDASYSLVCDLSGSLSQHRPAIHAAIGTCSALAHEVVATHEITGFDSTLEGPRHFQFKSFEEVTPSGLPALADDRVGGGGTPADAAVSFAAERLAARSDRERHMVLFIDGSPSDPEATRAQIAAARGRGQMVSIVGLGFDDLARSEIAKSFPEEDLLLAEAPDEVPNLFARVMVRASALHFGTR